MREKWIGFQLLTALSVLLSGSTSYAIDGLGSTSSLNSAQANGHTIALNATIAFLQNHTYSSSMAGMPTLAHALIPDQGGGYSFLYDTVQQSYQVPGMCGPSGPCTSPSTATGSYAFWAVWYQPKGKWIYAGYLYTDANGCTTQYNHTSKELGQWGNCAMTAPAAGGGIQGYGSSGGAPGVGNPGTSSSGSSGTSSSGATQ